MGGKATTKAPKTKNAKPVAAAGADEAVVPTETGAAGTTVLDSTVPAVPKNYGKLSDTDDKFVKVDVRSIKSNIGQSRGKGVLSNMLALGWRAYPNDDRPTKGDTGKCVMEELLSDDAERVKVVIGLLQDNEKHIFEMVGSLGRNGQIQPVIIRPCYAENGDVIEGEFNVSAGARRTIATAIRYAESGGVIAPTLNAQLMGPMEAQKELELALAENKDRLNQSPIDDALFYQKLRREHQMSVKDIAKAVMGDETKYQTVQQRIQLLRGTKEEIARCHEGKLGSSTLLAAIKKRADTGSDETAKDKPGVGERGKMPSVAQAKALMEAVAPSDLDDATKERFGVGKSWALIKEDNVRQALATWCKIEYISYADLKAKKEKERTDALAAAKAEADAKKLAAAKEDAA